MLFNSLDFFIFLPIVFLLYWFVFNRNIRLQNAFLVVVSYIFYGWWDYRFLALIILSSALDYTVCRNINITKGRRRRKVLLLVSLVFNLGALAAFKYYNFFVDSFVSVFTFFGQELDVNTLNILLPVGISFYTFQTLSYTIDVYRRKIKPTHDPIAFFAYVSFFPQLVAGPIERAAHLLPQFNVRRTFDYDIAVSGARIAFWGFFKKIVIADNCSIYVDEIFSNYSNLPSVALCLGVVLFSFQIYCDFSGYSDIAIGISRFFGFDLMRNFAYPYFSRDISEFWRRWHISLTTWFRDYVYIPLGGSRCGSFLKIRNILIVFLVSGLWHGANWTYVVWGAINALCFMPTLLLKKIKSDRFANGTLLNAGLSYINILATFMLVSFIWIFFRSSNLESSIGYIQSMIGNWNLPWGSADFLSLSKDGMRLCYIIAIIFAFQTMEWIGRKKECPLNIKSGLARRMAYVATFLVIIYHGEFNVKEFIYFQF